MGRSPRSRKAFVPSIQLGLHAHRMQVEMSNVDTGSTGIPCYLLTNMLDRLALASDPTVPRAVLIARTCVLAMAACQTEADCMHRLGMA